MNNKQIRDEQIEEKEYHGAAWCCVVLRGAAWCCVGLREAAWGCVVLRSAARCCEVLRGDAWWQLINSGVYKGMEGK